MLIYIQRVRDTPKERKIKMKVLIKVYDNSKFNTNSKKVAEVEYDVTKYEVKEIPADEILKEFDETDEYNEYLILTLANGETSTFRNSHVDMFRI